MSLPWTSKDVKALPTTADEVMILDAATTDPDAINKRATLGSLPSSGESNTASNLGGGVQVFAQKILVDFQFRTLLGETDKITLTENTDEITFTLGTDVVTIDKINTYGDFAQIFRDDKLFIQNPNETFAYQITASAIVDDIILTLPLLGVDDTFVTEAFSQTLTNKTIDADNNTISNLALGDEVTGASTDLTDSSNIALLDTLNDFTVGTTSLFFQSEGGSPADAGIIRLANIEDIAWKNAANDDNLFLSVDTNDFLRFNGFVAVTAIQGTSGEVLTSTGTGTAPTFQDAASGVFPVADNVMIIEGSGNDAKQLRFEVDGIDIGALRVITAPNQDVTLVSTIDGTISNTNVNSGALIDFSKLATLGAGNILVGSGLAVVTEVTMSGDATISNAGVVTVSLASTDLTDTANLVRVTTTNSYTAGLKQSFLADATTAGINFNDQVPSPFAAGDFWRNSDSLQYGDSTPVTRTLVDLSLIQTLTNKIIDGDDNTLLDIAVASLADGIAGQLITWDSSGVADVVTTGTSDQILTSNGAGSAPTFQAISAAAIFPVSDDTIIIEGDADATKQLKFDVSSNSLGALGTIKTEFSISTTITIPDATDTLVGKATTDTLTNKTLTAPILTGITSAEDVVLSERLQTNKGANIASPAGGILTLGDGNIFTITGTNTINEILETDWQSGSKITLNFAAVLTVTNNSGGTNDILLRDGDDYISAAGESLVLWFDGTDWNESSRSNTYPNQIQVLYANNTTSNQTIGSGEVQTTITGLTSVALPNRPGRFAMVAVIVNAASSNVSRDMFYALAQDGTVGTGAGMFYSDADENEPFTSSFMVEMLGQVITIVADPSKADTAPVTLTVITDNTSNFQSRMQVTELG